MAHPSARVRIKSTVGDFLRIYRLPGAHITRRTAGFFPGLRFSITTWPDNAFGRRPSLCTHSLPSTAWPNSSSLPGSAIHSGREACLRLRRILGEYRTTNQKEPLLPLFQVEDLLARFRAILPPDWLEGVLIYLANSWTREGKGLFDPGVSRNLSLAMDFAHAQSLIPYAKEGIQAHSELRKALKRILKGQFPHSLAFVNQLV